RREPLERPRPGGRLGALCSCCSGAPGVRPAPRWARVVRRMRLTSVGRIRRSSRCSSIVRTRGMGSGDLVAVFFEPAHRLGDALLEANLGLEAEALAGAVGVEATAWLAVGLVGVPDEIALEAGQALDQPGEVANRDLVA